MDYRIVEKESFRVIGICEPLKNNLEENFAVVPSMWQKASEDGTIQELMSMMDGEFKGILGVTSCIDKDNFKPDPNNAKYEYWISVKSK